MYKKKKTLSWSILSIAGVKPYKERKNEKYMNKVQLLHFKRILDSWRKHLINEVNRTNFSIQDSSFNFPDPIDRAVQEEEFNIKLKNRDRERKLIEKIEKTLKKILVGDFGYCDSCGIKIGIKRLEARPTASLCIDCKILAEMREKQIAG